MTTNETIVIDTPEGIAFVQLLAVRSGLRMEIATGMKMSRGVSMLKVANRICGTNFRRKEAALEHLNGLLMEFDATA